MTATTIDLKNIPSREEYLEWIEGFTSLPHRRTGTEEGWESAKYLERTFNQLGLSEVRIEEAPANIRRYEDYALNIHGTPINCFPINGTFHEHENGIFELGIRGENKNIIYLGNGDESDFQGINVKDKLVVCDCPWYESNEEIYEKEWCKSGAYKYDPNGSNRKQLGKKSDSYSPYKWPYNYSRAMAGGAAGFIGILVDYIDDGIFYNEDYTEEVRAHGFEALKTAGLWVGKSEGDKIKKILSGSKQPVIADMQLKAIFEKGKARNVIGVLPGKSNDVILVHSHHDAVFSGAVQDASGMSEVIGLAKYFSSIPEDKRDKTIMFAGFDGHYSDYEGHRDFLERRKAEGINIILDVVIEHIGKEIVLGAHNEPIETGEAELRIMYVSDNSALWSLAKSAIERNNIERTILIPTKSASGKHNDKYEFRQDEVISDAFYSAEAGIPVVSILSPPMYLFHPMDRIDMVADKWLRPIGIAFAEIISGVLGISEDLAIFNNK